MIKLLWRLGLLLAAVLFFTWLADRPGGVTITWLDREIEMTLVAAFALGLALLVALWFVLGLMRRLLRSPAATRRYLRGRKNRKAYESLSRGIIAAGAGDAAAAAKHAAIAGNGLMDEPLVNVLAAQAAQLKGDRAAVKRIFEEMTKSKETEVLGLRGLFAEARAQGDIAAATRHAERAQKLNPGLGWASTAMLQLASQRKDWVAAGDLLQQQVRQGALTRQEGEAKQAAVLASHALANEDSDREAALASALKAHKLDPSLVPAALVAARIFIAQGNKRKAAKALRETWGRFPHPDLAEVMAHLVPGEGPEARFERVRDLVKTNDASTEAQYALARAAVAAGRHDVARQALENSLIREPEARVCALMADIEEAQGDKGRAREWLSRAIIAPRDPLWVADGVASLRWTAVSPISGEIIRCQWKAPYEAIGAAMPFATEAVKPELPPTIRPLESPKAADVAQLPRPPDDPGPDGEPLIHHS
jgi:HemY protein